MSHASEFHAPVLCNAVMEYLVTDREGFYVDGTLGGGGHSEALLERLSPNARVLGIDRDQDAIGAARARLGKHANFAAVHSTFAGLPYLLHSRDTPKVDGLLLDLGVSSHQLDTAARGFSHRHEAPLDMRMDQGFGDGAHTLVNEWAEDALADVLFEFGEEWRSRRIAKAIVCARPIATTTELAAVVRRSVPMQSEAQSLARVFQAIRIAVNDELKELDAALLQAKDVVSEGGRLVIISYHSLEDRRVKRVMRYGNLKGQPVRDLYGRSLSPWQPLTKKPVTAGAEELARNPRARSAKLRAAERVVALDTNTRTRSAP